MWQLLILWCAYAAAGDEYLLPRAVTPTHYTLRYLVDIDPSTNFSFYAAVDISLKVNEETQKIVLHAKDFIVDSSKVALTKNGNMAARLSDFNMNSTYDFLTLNFDQALQPADGYILSIPFRGNLQNGLEGAYISYYVNKITDKKEYLVTTQFEAISARNAFPCFDEPVFKATFGISLGYNKGYEAISNMPQERSSSENALEDEWKWDDVKQNFRKDLSDFTWSHFAKSVPMSTYLVAFVISKFANIESPEGLADTKFRIWARKDAIDQASYASRVGPQVLSYYEKYFNVSFPLPKQDMVAIPDFSAGAMENWGLITYRETALLYDKEESSFVSKERVAEVIAHELAHQWFGNLVTMKWWSDLWLNEGFATYVASLGVAAIEPDWQADVAFAVDNIMGVLSLDGLESSHPVSIKIDDPKRINEIFDEISYKKGSSLIRMMVMFLGEDAFREGINRYLKKNSYQNAEQDDLWRELSSANSKTLPAGVSVKQVMDTWTLQTGYPLLNVTRDYEANTVGVTQKRYLSSGAPGGTASWWVPLSARTPRGAAPLQWLSADDKDAPHAVDCDVGKDEWLLLNYDMMAPLRVTYDQRNWQLLSSALASAPAQVPVTGRVQLLADAFDLAWSHRLGYDTVLQLASYLQHETEYLPLSTGLRALAKIENVIKRSPDYGAYQKYVRKLIGQTYEKIGGLATKSIKDDEDLNSVKMQTMVSSWACRMKVPGCEENAMELYQRWMDSDSPDTDNPIPLDLRRTVCCVGVSRGGVAHWRFAVERRRNANVAAVKDSLLAALACSRDVWLLNTYLEWAITDGSQVRGQDAAFVISSVTRSSTGYYTARDFIYSRIDDIAARFKGQARRIGHIVKVLLEQFTTQRELDEFMVWAEKNKQHLEDSKLALKQGLEKAKVNIAWLKQHSKEVVTKLRENSK